VSDGTTGRPDETSHVLARVADEVVPALAARLEASGLGELEIRHDGWRVRLRRSALPAAPEPVAGRTADPAPGSPAAPARRHALSPGVGYFTPSEKTPVGRAVRNGDALGWVDVLGVRQEVVAPHDGTVARILAEPGQAVEYGQELVVVDPARGNA